MESKSLRLFKEKRYKELVNDGRTPAKILHLILLSDDASEYIKAQARSLLEKKEHYAYERAILRHLREEYKKAVEEQNYYKVDDILSVFWSLGVVQQAYFYKVIIPNFGNIEESYERRRSYEYADTTWLEYNFADGVLTGKIKI